MNRHTAIEALLRRVPDDAVVITTAGMVSREAFAAMDRPGNFYLIGSMGLASSLGVGLALLADPRIVVVDGRRILDPDNMKDVRFRRIG